MIEKTTQKEIFSPRHIFLLSILICYVAVYFLQPEYAKDALQGFWDMLKKVVPALMMVFALLVLFHRYVKADMIKKQLGSDSGLRGWLFALVAGVLMLGPPYVLYPMLADMKKMGARYGLIAVFLYNRNVKIPFLPVMVLCFGLQYSLILSVYILIFSIINGILIEWFMQFEKK